MFTIPNLISLIRAPLALIFLQDDVYLRCISIVLAMVSDGLDGYLARRYKMASQSGTVIDPLMDKFFVFFILAVFWHENKINLWEASAMVCRDFSVILFGFYLTLTGNFTKYRFRSIWSGKVTTALQLSVLLGLTCMATFPALFYGCFILLGFLALVELYLSTRSRALT